jgi:hypothetical protein
MESLKIVLNLETEGFRDGIYGVTEIVGPFVIGGMEAGTCAGKPVVMIGIDDPDHDDNLFVAQTTLALFLTAADALKAKYGDPRT